MSVTANTVDRESHLCELCKQICTEIFHNSAEENSPSEERHTAFTASNYDGTVSLIHYGRIDELQQAMRSGCHLCSLFGRCLRLSRTEDKSTLSSASYSMRYSKDPSRFQLWLGSNSPQSRPHTLNILMGKIPSHWLTICRRYSSSLSSNFTGSPECFDLASLWLYSCFENHPRCSVQDEAPNELPSRLLHVRMVDEAIEVRLWLVEIEEDDEIQYLTLSHCWGKEEGITLTRDTLEDFTKSITLESLPQTFIDAIKVTLKLGFEYLWIDSLCIVQDDEEDWKRESTNMGSIYRNGACNIAARGAHGDHQGCLVERTPLGFLPLEIICGGMTIHIEPPSFSESRDIEVGGVAGSDRTPLSDRAWVLQEVILSPRTIYYGSELLSWECITLDAFEGEPATAGRLRSLNPGASKDLFDDPSNIVQPVSEAPGGSTRWDTVLQMYTGGKLTRQSDRWIAIAGLATKLAGMAKLSIVAGMWRETLANDLLWNAWRPAVRVANGAPSWSWLSLEGMIQNIRGQGHELALSVYSTPDESPSEQTWTTIDNVEGPTTWDVESASKMHPLIIKGRLRQFFISGASVTSTDYSITRSRLIPDVLPWPRLDPYGILYSHDFPLNNIFVLLVVPTDDTRVAWRRIGVLHVDLKEGNIFNDLSTQSEEKFLDEYCPESFFTLI